MARAKMQDARSWLLALGAWPLRRCAHRALPSLNTALPLAKPEALWHTPTNPPKDATTTTLKKATRLFFCLSKPAYTA
eukprot:scaffold315855_cov30-Tisochrysis_lutea.AAC.1